MDDERGSISCEREERPSDLPVSIQGMRPPSSDSPSGLLYHYTNVSGIQGIIESGNIWATHVRYLNDSAELVHAYATKFTDSLFATLLPEGNEELRSNIREKALKLLKNYAVFIISLTGAHPSSGSDDPGDQLSQWRAYADRTGGFSLGFDVGLAERSFGQLPLRRVNGTLWLFRCVYEDEEKHTILADLGKQGLDYAKQLYGSKQTAFAFEHGRQPSEHESAVIVTQCAIGALSKSSTDLLITAAKFKDCAFREEQEWRVVLYVEKDKLMASHSANRRDQIVFFRQGQSGVVPYIKYPLDLRSENNPLRRIVVGPCPHPEESVESVRMLLEANGIKGVEVLRSSAPYRYW